MKNVVILHGTGETKDSFWFPWLTKELEKRGYSVSLPQLPDANHPGIKKWLPVALKETYTPETVLIGHSAGCPLQLSVLENLDLKIKQAILVAGYARPKLDDPNTFKTYWLIVQKVRNSKNGTHFQAKREVDYF
ncbi:alpha/beta hydrolase [Candidatus Daviesbacteria bacterium]|nr:alpha/beta hydrolase [Candidatus Daviesbacteria bacterium]